MTQLIILIYFKFYSRDIKMVFNLHSEVQSVIMMNGFCFVNTLSIEGATRALAALQGSRLHGHELKINFAKDK